MLIFIFAASFFVMNKVFASNAVFTLRSGEEIQLIVLTNTYGTFIFVQDPDSGDWTVETNGIQYRVNAPKMTLVLGVLSNLPVKRTLESEKEEYGLAYPAARTIIETTKGKRYEYIFGRIGTDVNTVYAKNSSGAVILTDSSVLDQVTGNLAAYRDKKVFFVDLLKIESLEFISGGRSVISCNRESPTEWYMDFPFAAPARHIELTELIARMTGWVIAGYPEAVDLREAGLNPPLETLVLKDKDGKKQTLDFGRNEGLYRYARTGGEGDIVFLYAADADLSILSPDTLLFIAPLKSQMDQVSAFSVSYGNETWSISYDQVSGTAFWNHGILTSEEFVSVYFKFISMVADGRIKGSVPQQSGSPVAVLSLNRIDGISSRLELFPYNEDNYFMRINGEDTPYYIHAKRLSGLLERISVLAGGKSTTMSL